jgi:hypothetical protein
LSGNTKSIRIANAWGIYYLGQYPLLILYNVIEDSELGMEFDFSALRSIVYKNVFRNLKVGIEVTSGTNDIQFNRNTFSHIESPIRLGSIDYSNEYRTRPRNISFLKNNFIHDLETDLIKIYIGSDFSFSNNNFLVDISGSSYIINNLTGIDVNAPSNFWNTSDVSVINSKIFDRADDFAKGQVIFANYLSAQNTDGPMAAPPNVYKGLHDNDIQINWNPNEQSTLAGYKIYSKSDLSDEFTLIADVGNVTSFVTDQLTISDIIVVTSYNDQADGTKDILQGYESDYSKTAENYISNLSIPSNNLCEGAILEVDVNSVYNFTDNFFILQLSNINGSFDNAINLDSISSSNETFSAMLPDTIQYGTPYHIRVLSTELNFYSESLEITRYKNPSISFEANESVCFNENYKINFVGSDYNDVSWDFNGANIISGSGAGPYLLNWNTSGLKAINFSAFNNGCSEDTTILVNIPAKPYTPEICIVTVDEVSSKSMLVWSYDLESVNQFGVYRETNVSGDYALVEYVDGGISNTYIDNQSSPEKQSNRYKLTSVDSCGMESGLSIYHKTIHLTIGKGIGNLWNLMWNGYEGFSFGTYRIYRSLDDGEFEVLTEIASNNSSYTDTEVTTTDVAYLIEVLNPNDCGISSGGRNLASSSSRSNIATYRTILEISELDKAIKIFPNPTSDYAHVQFEENLIGEYYLHNLMGQTIEMGTLSELKFIDMTDQSPGVYFVTIKTSAGSTHKKIVKE